MKANKLELETAIKTITSQRDTAVTDLSVHQNERHKLIKNHDIELKSLHDQRLAIQNENSELKAKEQHFSSDCAQLQKRLDAARGEISHLETSTHGLKNDISKKSELIAHHEKIRSDELDRRDKMLNDRDVLITRLKEELRSRDEELDDVDEENQIRVLFY